MLALRELTRTNGGRTIAAPAPRRLVGAEVHYALGVFHQDPDQRTPTPGTDDPARTGPLRALIPV